MYGGGDFEPKSGTSLMMPAIEQGQFWTGYTAAEGSEFFDLDLLLREMGSHPATERDVQPSTDSPWTAPTVTELAPVQCPMMSGAQPGTALLEEVQPPAVQQTTQTTTRRRRRTDETPRRNAQLKNDASITRDDLALATLQGKEKFDPQTCAFDEGMLTPQPILPKSKKTFVPESEKDSSYWIKRTRNNMAAKKSREARRVKENQKVLRLAFLEKENGDLRQQLQEALQENTALKERLSAQPQNKSLEKVMRENAQLRQVLSKMCEIMLTL